MIASKSRINRRNGRGLGRLRGGRTFHPAKESARQREVPYRRVQLNAWLGSIGLMARTLNETGYQVADGSCGRSSSRRSCQPER